MSFKPGELVSKPAPSPPSNPANRAALIFLHGFGDEAAPWASLADQFHAANKLAHLQWLIPTAPDNHDAMSTAWYTPSRLTPFPSSRPELDDDEDEEGMLKSREYIVSLIDGLVADGVPENRIVLAGFSQGHCMALLTSLTSKYADKLGGIVCLSGYMPLEAEIGRLRRDAGLPERVQAQVPMFIVRGKNDMLVPRRYHGMQLAKLKALGVEDDVVEAHEYEALGHQVIPKELFDLIGWLEKVVPSLE